LEILKFWNFDIIGKFWKFWNFGIIDHMTTIVRGFQTSKISKYFEYISKAFFKIFSKFQNKFEINFEKAKFQNFKIPGGNF